MELIRIDKVTLNGEEVNGVSARDLHEKLEVGTRFDKWIQRRIETYDFTENVDFITIAQKRATAQGNETNYNDYILTLDMAKELAMVENNEMGKKIRRYFIQVEKEFKQALVPKNPLLSVKVNLTDDRWRKAIYLGFNGRCYYTGQELDENNFHIDHIQPKSLGGQDILVNLVLCHPTVNRKKSDSYDEKFVNFHQKRILSEFGEKIFNLFEALSVTERLVSKDANQAMFNPAFMDKLINLIGEEATRDFYLKLLPGIDKTKVITTDDTIVRNVENSKKAKDTIKEVLLSLKDEFIDDREKNEYLFNERVMNKIVDILGLTPMEAKKKLKKVSVLKVAIESGRTRYSLKRTNNVNGNRGRYYVLDKNFFIGA